MLREEEGGGVGGGYAALDICVTIAASHMQRELVAAGRRER